MARKARKPFVDFAVFAAVRLAIALIQALPHPLPFKFANVLGWLAWRIDKRHRIVAAENLRHAFPEWSESRIDRVVRASYRHMALMVVEIALLPRKLHITSWRRYATMEPGFDMLAPLYSPRAALFVTGHFGNWEFAGWLMGLFGFHTHAIARVLDNPRLEAFFKKFRQSTGQTIIAKKDDFDRLSDVMKQGGKVATLADQDAGPRGLFVPFFGRPASTHKAVALMAIEFDAPLIVIGFPRLAEPMFYGVVCEEVIDPRDYSGRPDAVKAITLQYTAALERMVRRYPEQYFWFHRRWKHQPVERVKKPQSLATAA
jgi:KDO2-lipid IV(A) lauroyltransferase